MMTRIQALRCEPPCATADNVPDGAGAGHDLFACPGPWPALILRTVGDEEFADYIADNLAGLPGVLAVSLGGSRASGANRPDSDWDFAVYYRGRFDPGDLGALGWPGEVFPVGGWGGGVFNGGAWLRVGDRPVDVHYRDLDDVEHQVAEAREGRFGIERLMFHLAGIPTYIVAAELALHRVLRGRLPRPEYPDKLRVAASQRWRADARLTLGYARSGHAARGHVADTAGFIATAAAQVSPVIGNDDVGTRSRH
jgi:hypothetical protein